MIPNQMSRKALEQFVIHHCCRFKKDCHPFKAGEYYEQYQDVFGIHVWTDGPEKDVISFTHEEAEEYIICTL